MIPNRACRRRSPPPARAAQLEQLGKFCVVGAIGYGINLAPAAWNCRTPGLHDPARSHRVVPRRGDEHLPPNRAWTFRYSAVCIAAQGMRFFVVSLASLGANLILLRILIAFGGGKSICPRRSPSSSSRR